MHPIRPKTDCSGFILVGMMFTMLLMGVAALSMNRTAGMESRVTSNRLQGAQIRFGRTAAMEDARWELEKNPAWRTAAEGDSFPYKRRRWPKKRPV